MRHQAGSQLAGHIQGASCLVEREDVVRDEAVEHGDRPAVRDEPGQIDAHAVAPVPLARKLTMEGAKALATKEPAIAPALAVELLQDLKTFAELLIRLGADEPRRVPGPALEVAQRSTGVVAPIAVEQRQVLVEARRERDVRADAGSLHRHRAAALDEGLAQGARGDIVLAHRREDDVVPSCETREERLRDRPGHRALLAGRGQNARIVGAHLVGD